MAEDSFDFNRQNLFFPPTIVQWISFADQHKLIVKANWVANCEVLYNEKLFYLLLV